MDASEESLATLFKTDVRFVVPRYQRRYVWSKKNWAALWNDILETVDRYTGPAQVPTYFLGAAVLFSEPVGGPRTMVERQVIDGQQRLATLQVLFAAIRDVAVARGVDDRYLRTLRKLTHNDDEMSTDDDDRYKLWPTRHDWDAFRLTMDERGSEGTKDPHALIQAHTFFVRAVQAWLAPVPADRLSATLDRLLTVLNHGLRLMVIDLKPGDNPQIIFESLNGRGMPLQTSDLVRNHIFLLAEAQQVKVDRLYEEHWARFEDGFWRQDIGKGPRGGARLDTFLAYFLTMELKDVVPHQELFPHFRRYVAPQTKRLRELVARFAAYGEIYRALDQRITLDPYEQQFMSRLDVLDTSSVMPLLLHVFGEYEGEVRWRIIELLESYLIRRVIVGEGAKSYTTIATGVLKRLEGASDPVQAVRDQLSSYQGKTTAWPSDADIVENVRQRSMATTDGKRIRLILSVIDQGLRTPKSEHITYDIDCLTVEHLMPQSWNAHWPLGTATADERRKLVYTLGNLTLITGHLNGELGNEAWLKKRSALVEYSRLHLNQGLPDKWNEDSIRARGATFAQVLIRVLPGPSATTTLFSPVDDPDLDGLDEAEGETLAEEMEPEAPAVEPAPMPFAHSDNPIARHVYEVLGKHSIGTRLTPRQIARTTSTDFPQQRPSVKDVAALIEGGALSGIEITTNKSGHRAVKLSKQQIHPEMLDEATTILRAPIGATDDDTGSAAFHVEMVQLHARARDEAGYSASIFLHQVKQRGGLAVAKHILSGGEPTAGFRKLLELNRLDLTVEALALREEFARLFTDDELARARDRLVRHGGVPDQE